MAWTSIDLASSMQLCMFLYSCSRKAFYPFNTAHSRLRCHVPHYNAYKQMIKFQFQQRQRQRQAGAFCAFCGDIYDRQVMSMAFVGRRDQVRGQRGA